MKIKIKQLTAIILITLMVLPLAIGGAVPGIPHQFYGTVTIDGVAAVDGLTVKAKINGETYASTVTSDGKYGWATMFKVDADDPDTTEIIEGGVAGDTISFYVDGILATPTYTFTNGASTPLNLVATGAVTPDPDTGTLIITTTPVTGAVSVDGVLWTPASQEIEVGTYAVSFGNVALYDTPADDVAVVTDGGTTIIVGVYVLTVVDPDTGTLSITTSPVLGEVFVDDVSWGTAPQSRVIDVGAYIVSFGDMTGYLTPPNQWAPVTVDPSSTITGYYVLTPVDPDDPVVPGEGFTIDDVTIDDVTVVTVEYDDTLVVIGSGVTGGADVEVYWDSVSAWDGVSGLLNTTDGNPSGTFDLWIDIPSGLAGEHYLWAKDVLSGDTAMYGPLTMVPRIKMSPSSGLVDDRVTITGYGFGDEVDISSVVTGAGDLKISPSTPDTDELGYWTAKFDALDATFTVTATDEDGNTVSKEWKVGPAIELDVDEGPVGTVVEVSGRGFTKDSTITIPFPVDQEDDITVKNDGTFSVDIVIPQVSKGDYTIVVTESPGTSTAEEDFDVDGLAEIEVTPGHGSQGSSITVEGWNFTQFEATVYVTLDGEGETEFETDNDGHFEGTFIVPAVATGEYKDGLVAWQTDSDVDYGIDASADFRAGLMIVILNPESGPAGTIVTITGTGFTKDADWNATFGDDTWQEDVSAVDTEISARLYAPSVDAGIYTVSLYDIEAEIMVDVLFEITDATMIESDPVQAPAGYAVELTGYFFSEDLPVVIDDFVLYNATDEWDDNDMVKFTVVVEEDDDEWDDGYFEITFTLPDDEELSIGSYTMNVTDSNDMFAQLVFEIVDEIIDIDSRKPEYSIGDTLAFDVESSFAMDKSYIEISNPSGDIYWSTDVFSIDDPDMWLKVGTIQRVLYADQVAGGNPMVFLEDAPLGSWTWEYYDDEDEEVDTGAFTVSAGAADLVSGQVEDLANDIDALVGQLDDLSSQVSDVTGEFVDVRSDIAGVADLARAAADAATKAAEAVSSVATVAGDAADAADAAAEAANAAKDAATGLTTLVYGAIGASLVAALAAIVSLMQISRRIAG